MEISLFLAKFWGWMLVILGLIFLLRRKALGELFNLINDRSFILLSGYIALLLGLATVILHNVWVADWRIVITIFGWLSLIKGIVRIGFPEIMQKSVSVFKGRFLLTKILFAACILLGFWLIWMSC